MILKRNTITNLVGGRVEVSSIMFMPQHRKLVFTITNPALIAILLNACGGGGGGGAAPARKSTPEPDPMNMNDGDKGNNIDGEGIFLRLFEDVEVKVYSNGAGVLAAGRNGSTEQIVIGTFSHDDAHATNSDGVTLAFVFSLLDNLEDFKIEDNQLAFIGAESSTLPTTLKITAIAQVTMDLPDGTYYDVDATGDDDDADIREFAFMGGDISDIQEVAAVENNPAHRTIDVAAGKIYIADAVAHTGRMISFAAVDDMRIDEDSYIIVTDNGDGTGAVSAVATLPPPPPQWQ